MKTDFTLFTNMTAAQRAKLPAYARDYIEWLERKLHETEYTLYEETTRLGQRKYVGFKLTDERHEPENGIIVGPSDEHPLAINDIRTVRFWLAGTHHDRFIDVRLTASDIEVMGGCALAIMPRSSNYASVKLVTR